MCRRRSPGLVLLLLCCLAVPAVAEDAAGSGTLIVSVSQAGAAIILDGELRGDSPLDPIDGVPTGPHVLEVQLGGFSSATREFFLQAG